MSDCRRIIDDELFAHFITFSVNRRRRLLDLEQPKRIVLGVLNYAIEKHAARCAGFVIMPDHVHALIWFPELGQLSPFMHEWKRQSSLRIRAWYRENASNYVADFGEGKTVLATQILSVRDLHDEESRRKAEIPAPQPSTCRPRRASRRLALEFRPLVRTRPIRRRTHHKVGLKKG
jgi:REP element-mobilizing transposase RayT